jgi:type IV pilus biogenesis protein CpaD/CtpE
MTIRPIAVLTVALTVGLTACASQPSGPPASTTSQSMALPPAGTSAAAPASPMQGMSAEEHQRMMQRR